MSLITSPLLLPTSASERISSSMLASLGSSVSACCRRRSRISFSRLNWARLLAIDCFWISSSSSWRRPACSRVICCWIGSMRRYQLPAVSRPTIRPRPTTFCERGALVIELRMSCPVSATVPSSGRVVRVAVDLPLHCPALVLLRRLLDGDVGEVLRGLQLLGERREVLVGHRQPAHHHIAVLLAVLGDPCLAGDDGGELVHHLYRPGAAFLLRVEDLQLVLERPLVLGDRLHLADGLLQLGDLGSSGGDALLERVQAVVLRLPPGVVAEEPAHQDEPEEDQLLAAELALLGGADGEQVDVDHRRLLRLPLVGPAQSQPDRHRRRRGHVHHVVGVEPAVVDLHALER